MPALRAQHCQTTHSPVTNRPYSVCCGSSTATAHCIQSATTDVQMRLDEPQLEYVCQYNAAQECLQPATNNRVSHLVHGLASGCSKTYLPPKQLIEADKSVQGRTCGSWVQIGLCGTKRHNRLTRLHQLLKLHVRTSNQVNSLSQQPLDIHTLCQQVPCSARTTPKMAPRTNVLLMVLMVSGGKRMALLVLAGAVRASRCQDFN